MTDKSNPQTGSRFDKIKERVLKIANYCWTNVWADDRKSWKVSLVKILNLTVKSIMNPNFQNLAAAMTYRTVLAIVPVLALLFAICRGFGFQNLLTSQLYSFFPSQRKAMETALSFVDSYLAQASEGVFVGVGIVFLLWTVISLLSNLEDSFNTIFNVKEGRTLWRKATDYLGIFIVLPILIISSTGITVVLDTTLKRLLPIEFLTPAISLLFEFISFLISCLLFASCYMLIPNTKVRFANAFAAGTLAALAYTVLQWLFVSGQMYVSKYNAIYGSFSFLPLLLIWLQLVWLFTFVGAEVCYASQNFSRFNFQNHIADISLSYLLKVDLAVMAIIAKRFAAGRPPVNAEDISRDYGIPLMLSEKSIERLLKAGIINHVVTTDGAPRGDVAPSRDVSTLTIGGVLAAIYDTGQSDFIPGFATDFAGVGRVMASVSDAMLTAGDTTPLTTIDISRLADTAA